MLRIVPTPFEYTSYHGHLSPRFNALLIPLKLYQQLNIHLIKSCAECLHILFVKYSRNVPCISCIDKSITPPLPANLLTVNFKFSTSFENQAVSSLKSIIPSLNKAQLFCQHYLLLCPSF